MLFDTSDEVAPEELAIMKYDAYGNYPFRPKRPLPSQPRERRPELTTRPRRTSRRAATPRAKLTAA